MVIALRIHIFAHLNIESKYNNNPAKKGSNPPPPPPPQPSSLFPSSQSQNKNFIMTRIKYTKIQCILIHSEIIFQHLKFHVQNCIL